MKELRIYKCKTCSVDVPMAYVDGKAQCLSCDGTLCFKHCNAESLKRYDEYWTNNSEQNMRYDG